MGRNTDDLVRFPRIKGLKFDAPLVVTLGADLTLDNDMPTLLQVDPTTDGRKVIMQVADAYNAGMVFILYNASDSTETILVRSPTDAGTIGTVEPTDIAIIINIAGVWRCGVMADIVTVDTP